MPWAPLAARHPLRPSASFPFVGRRKYVLGMPVAMLSVTSKLVYPPKLPYSLTDWMVYIPF